MLQNYEIKFKTQFLILFFLYVFSIIAKADTYNIWPTTGNVNDTLFHFEVSTTTAVPNTHYIGMSWNGGNSVRLSGTGKDWSLSTKVPIAGTYDVKFHLHTNDGTKVGDLSWSGSFSVAPLITQQAPTISIENASTIVEQGSTFTVRIKADDQDSNLRDIRIIWGDNDSETFANISGGSATLNGSHIYSSPGTYYWHVVVYDNTAKSTITSAQSVIVAAPESKPITPVISVSPSLTATPGTPMLLSISSADNASSFKLCLGSSSGNYNYGCTPTTSPLAFTMGNGWDYFVAVKAVNGSSESDYSNELHVSSQAGQHLSILNITPTVASINRPTVFTIQGKI